MTVFRELAEEPYEHRGIIHSELALILHTVTRLGISRIIESGRARGQSTYILGKYLPDVTIHSIEMRGGEDSERGRARVSHLGNVILHEGDGSLLVPELASVPQPTAILLDGPKGAAAVSILKWCFEFRHVLVGFIHDMRRLDHGGPSPHRADAIARLPRHKFSDDPALVAGSSWMDANVVKAGGPCGPQHEAVFGSYGPTLGAFLNPQQ